MEKTMLIAQILGVVYLAVGLGMAFNKNHYNDMVKDFLANKAVMYIGGAMALVVGVLIVKYHSVWDDFTTGLISVIGWIAMVKGVFILVLPKVTMDITKKMWNSSIKPVATLVAIVAGAYFSYVGFLQ